MPGQPYGPRATLGEPDLRLPLGSHTAEFFASEIESLGLIGYLYVLRVVDDEGGVAFYLTAETSPLAGPQAIYFGRFLSDSHATLACGAAFADPAVFIWKAIEQARGMLGLDDTNAPP